MGINSINSSSNLGKSIGENIGVSLEIKNKIQFLLSLENFKNLEINNFSDFVTFQISLNEEINIFFAQEIENESEDFKKVATKSNTSNTFKGFKTENEEEKSRLLSILTRKKELYLAFLLNMINNNKLDKILSNDDIDSLKIILNSGFIQFIDKLFLNNDVKEIIAYEKPEKQVYGFLKKDLGEISFATDKINEFMNFREIFSSIKNENIREYLLGFINLSLLGNTNYDEYITLEKYALNTWDNNSKLGFMHPLENYELPGYTDLEFSFVLKDISEGVDNSKFYSDLFMKYFADDYHANGISVFDVEKIFSAGNSSYMSVLGQAFPNDVKSKKEYGNKITIYNSNIRKGIEENYEITKKVISNLPILDEGILTAHDSDFVIAHEFSHSLFRNGYKSELEESKASFGYLLKIYDQYKRKEIPQKEIEYIITNILIEIIKQARRDGIASYKQYILYAKMALASMINIGVLKVNNEEISINFNSILFKEFLDSGVDTLKLMKGIYENNEKDFEKKIIKIIEENIEENYKLILKKIKEN